MQVPATDKIEVTPKLRRRLIAASRSERFGNAILSHVDLVKIFPYIGSPVDRRPGVRKLLVTTS